MRKYLLLAVGLAVALALLVACSSGSAGPSGSSSSGSTGDPSPSGQTIVNERCSRCHALTRIQGARKSGQDWDATVTRMDSHGLQLTPAEKAAVVDYLAATYGP